MVRSLMRELQTELAEFDRRIASYDRRIREIFRANEQCQRPIADFAHRQRRIILATQFDFKRRAISRR